MAVYLPSDILPENKVFSSLCSKSLLRVLEQRLPLISQEVAFLNLDCILPIATGFKIYLIKRLFLRDLFTPIAIFTYSWLQNMAAYSCRTNVIIEFYEKKVGTAED